MIVEGKANLAEVMRIIQPWLSTSLYFSFFSKTQPYLLKNSTNELVNILVNKPIFFYVKKNTLITNNSYMGIEDYLDSLLAVEDIFSLMILYNLPAYEQAEIEIHWIMCESPAMINKSIMISLLCFVDFFLDRNTSNTVGRLDYKKFEDLFLLLGGAKFITALTIGKKCKSVLSCILKIFPTYKKNEYVTSVDEEGNEYDISKENLKAVYRTKCYVCDDLYSVILHGNTKERRNDKYILPNEMLNTFVQDKQLYIELICQKCLQDRIKNRPILAVKSKPKLLGEYNNTFLKIYNSVIIDENAVMQQSQIIIDRIQSNEKNNDAE